MVDTLFRCLFPIVLALIVLDYTLQPVQADIVVHDQLMVAEQNVNLFGIDAVLVASGLATFTFDVDANNNTIRGGMSTVETLFLGTLPDEFAPLGVAGAAFELFSLDPELVTASGDGTHVRIDTTFGLRLLVAPGVVGATFFTAIPSIFETDVIGLQDFTGSVFQDPSIPNDFTEIFIGDSIIPGLPPAGTLVGVNFNRTVTAIIPEPACSAMILATVGVLSLRQRRRTAN